jgi:hypothetical protein
MAITVTEKFDSRPAAAGEGPTAELKYVIKGTDDEQEALTALGAAAGPTYAGLTRKGWSVEPVGDPTVSLLWDGTVRYGRYDTSPPAVGESSYSFDTGGGTTHITQGIAHVASYSAGIWKLCAPPDHGGAIGVTHDSVEGVDITIPDYHFSETHYIANAVVTPAYKAALFALTGKVNSDEFKGFAIGEVKFMGASGSQRGDDDWEITFNYAASPNVADACANWPSAVKPAVPVPKKGWEDLWVEYRGAGDDDAKCVVQKPRAVHIEQVYYYASFAWLP